MLGIGLTYFVTPHLLGWALHSEKMQKEAMGFLRIRIWGLPFLYVYLMRNALLVGTNRSRFLVYGTLAEVIVNMSLDYGLIFGHFGLPAIGFDGAAYASVAAEAAGMIVIFAVIHVRGIGRELQLFGQWKFSSAHFRLILVQSIPLILQYSFSILCWLSFYVLIEHHGQLDLAVSNTMRNIGGIFGVFTLALGSSAVAMVSNIMGQGREEQVMRLTWKIAKISLLFWLAGCSPAEFVPGALPVHVWTRSRVYGKGYPRTAGDLGRIATDGFCQDLAQWSGRYR